MPNTEDDKYQIWQREADKLEREYTRLAWRCVCEVKNGGTERAKKTAEAAWIAFEEFSEHVAGRVVSVTEPSAETAE